MSDYNKVLESTMKLYRTITGKEDATLDYVIKEFLKLKVRNGMLYKEEVISEVILNK